MEEVRPLTAKEYLQQIYHADRCIKMLVREKNDLRDCLYAYGRSPSDLTADRVQSSVDPDKMLNLISKLREKEDEITQRIDELVDIKTVISGQIQKLNNPKYIELLHSRYVLCAKWEVIAVQMDTTERWIYKLHGMALQEFSKQFSPFKRLGH